MGAKTGKRRKSGVISALVLGILFGIALVVIQELAYQVRLTAQYTAYTEYSAGLVEVISDPVPVEEPVPDPEPEEPDPPEEDDDSFAPNSYRYLEDEGEYAIRLGDTQIMAIDFEALKATNAEFVGWFIIPDTDISYPVVQGTDNSFYLDHAFDGSYNRAGALFVDNRNTLLHDENTIIYGHNFHQYSMLFSQLVYYADQSFYDTHPVGYFLTESGGYVFELFSAYEAETSDPVYQRLSYADWEEYGAFVEYAKGKSAFASGVTVADGDKIVTLSTCSNESRDGRFVVIGKVVAFPQEG